MTVTTIALGRRRIESVDSSVLTKAGTGRYFSQANPRYAERGLDPTPLYRLMRPALAVGGRAGKPLPLRYRAVSAADHPADIIVGCVGHDVSFDGEPGRRNLALEDV
jgi:hypothetical protein